MFNITKICVDEKGNSFFRDALVPLNQKGLIGSLSETFPSQGLVFRIVEPDYDWDFHHAPQKQFICLLDGEIEIETSNGEKRRFIPGDILLAEDTWGKGHCSRNITPVARRSLFIFLPEDYTFPY
ncbi:MAG: hypothetical protein HC906_09000 [Bacteroidales bacterium]|nr:hypothetical protein [Bacteroidales bacterium]